MSALPKSGRTVYRERMEDWLDQVTVIAENDDLSREAAIAAILLMTVDVLRWPAGLKGAIIKLVRRL